MDTRAPAACWLLLPRTTWTETLMGQLNCTPASPTPKVLCITTPVGGFAGIRVAGSVVSASHWSDPTCSTCLPSGTSTWTASQTGQCGTLPGTGLMKTTITASASVCTS